MGDYGMKEDVALQSAVKANRGIKDSVFRDLFSDKKYLFQLYQVLHPEDTESTEEDLEYVTLEQVLVRDLYNDLGFRVGSRLLILVEAQSTWTVNIIPRCLMYLARTYQEYFRQSTQSLFSTSPVEMPEPELYVIYTGESRIDREYISLSEEFFGGRKTALDVCVRVMTDGQDGDIINQYVVFTKVMDGQARIYGRTREAVREAIRICKDRDVLKEYLENREKEVVDIMITLYDQQQVLEEYVASEKKKVADETAKRVADETAKRVADETAKRVADETAKNTAMKLHKMNLSVKDISEAVGYSMEIVRTWLDLLPQA